MIIKLKSLCSESIHDRIGKCYELAGRYVTSNPNSILVHGKLINPYTRGFKELDHAWVEDGGDILDPVMDIKMPKEAYESWFKVKPYKKYTHTEVLKLTLETGNWGPW